MKRFIEKNTVGAMPILFLKKPQKHMMEKTQPLPQIMLGKVVICLQKTETRSMPVTCTSINSKWIKDFNIGLKPCS
jgi:hypothetical protein